MNANAASTKKKFNSLLFHTSISAWILFKFISAVEEYCQSVRLCQFIVEHFSNICRNQTYWLSKMVCQFTQKTRIQILSTYSSWS